MLRNLKEFKSLKQASTAQEMSVALKSLQRNVARQLLERFKAIQIFAEGKTNGFKGRARVPFLKRVELLKAKRKLFRPEEVLEVLEFLVPKAIEKGEMRLDAKSLEGFRSLISKNNFPHFVERIVLESAAKGRVKSTDLIVQKYKAQIPLLEMSVKILSGRKN